LWFRQGYILLCVLRSRARYVTAWLASEVTCLAAGVGYNPTKPDLVDQSTFHAFDCAAIEFSTDIRGILRNWNCTVQTWMVLYVYKRVPLKNTLLRRLAVMVTSAFWHGVEPGYYVAFLLVTLAQSAQDQLWPSERSRWPGQGNPHLNRIYGLIQWLITQVLLSFSTISFIWCHPRDFITVYRLCNLFFVQYLFMAFCSLMLLGYVRENFFLRAKEMKAD